MAVFKAGDRVRIICSTSKHKGKEGTVLEVMNNHPHEVRGRITYPPVHYRVCVDGFGSISSSGFRLAYLPHDLTPVTPPNHAEWAKEKVRQVTTPKPSRLLEREKA